MSDIVGYEACAQELKRLLAEIAANIEEAGTKGPETLHAAVLSETRKLVDYTNRTEPSDLFDTAEVESISKLDQVADDARREIFGDSADLIIGRIQERVSQINQLAKAVKQQTATNERKAKTIRLIPVRNTIDALTDTVETLKQAKEALADEQADEAEIKAKVDGVLRAITALQKAARDV